MVSSCLPLAVAAAAPAPCAGTAAAPRSTFARGLRSAKTVKCSRNCRRIQGKAFLFSLMLFDMTREIRLPGQGICVNMNIPIYIYIYGYVTTGYVMGG